MQLTIDSNQPLDDVLRVVGAMFNVTLAVQGGDAAEPAASRRRTASASGRRRTAAVTRRAGRRPARGARAVTAADVRRWAVENGYRVADKGRVPGSVMQAYAAAHA